MWSSSERSSLSGVSRRLIVTDAALAVFEPGAVAVELEDVNVVDSQNGEESFCPLSAVSNWLARVD